MDLVDCAGKVYKPPCKTCETIFDNDNDSIKQDALLGIINATKMGETLEEVVSFRDDPGPAMAYRRHYKRLPTNSNGRGSDALVFFVSSTHSSHPHPLRDEAFFFEFFLLLAIVQVDRLLC